MRLSRDPTTQLGTKCRELGVFKRVILSEVEESRFRKKAVKTEDVLGVALPIYY